MASYRGALIGCGFFAINQLHAWRDAEGVDIVALCDRDPERLAHAGGLFGIDRRYGDAEQMLRAEKPDFVDIATTVASHRPLVELAAKMGIPVICQKPFALSMADARAMVEACSLAGVPLMVHENFRWQSAIQAVKTRLDGNAIGQPFWARVSFRSGFDVFSGQPYLAEGKRFIIEDLGIHILDIARFLFGEVTRLNARTRRVNPAIKGEDVATMLLDHASGLSSMVDCSYATRLPVDPFPETLVEIDGSTGTLRLGAGYRLTVNGPGGQEEVDLSPPLLPWASRPWHNIQESVLAIQRHWLHCLHNGEEPSTSGRDNIATMALVEAAYASAASGQTIEMASI
ncbi:Gfo/Idh/MocA family oxidoreductase [Labrys sp. KNU-23]|uniref:Gfo/Idh/MocA family protein n=1 Tax=Labrys sp. KNU-23 TaxID=2789216 RepID=UPI0011ECCE8F|nr:Gfo/Idh/MocA family oxidoreductase [Labrys sp. KNU-23]QEN85751.1 Gfo/Idh/MocA family oxidoreductase [Labrys sp. KNU-23]